MSVSLAFLWIDSFANTYKSVTAVSLLKGQGYFFPAAKESTYLKKRKTVSQNMEEAKWNTNKSQGLISAVAMETLAHIDKEKLTELHNHALMYFAHYQIETLFHFLKMSRTLINNMNHYNQVWKNIALSPLSPREHEAKINAEEAYILGDDQSKSSALKEGDTHTDQLVI